MYCFTNTTALGMLFEYLLPIKILERKERVCINDNFKNNIIEHLHISRSIAKCI